MRYNEITEDIKQQFPLSQHNQDNGRISYVAKKIEDYVVSLEQNNNLDLLDDYETLIDLNKLHASQHWLASDEGGGDPVIHELDALPVVAKINNEYVIVDGHHRLNFDLSNGYKKAKVFLFDINKIP